MAKSKKKQEEVVIENVEPVVEVETPKTTPEKKVAKEKKVENKVQQKELTGTWKKETNPITFAVKYKCSNCGKYIVPDSKPISKIDTCIFCGSKNQFK